MDNCSEWLETDGLGGFASGCVDTVRRRRYHGLLVTATNPPTGRVMLVPGLEAWANGSNGREALHSHRYAPDVVHPDGRSRIRTFTIDPWPTWIYRLSDGAEIRAEVFATPPHARIVLRWTLLTPDRPAVLSARPLLAARDYHALQREDGAASLGTSARDGLLSWQLYPDAPAVNSRCNGEWSSAPTWFRQFQYDFESERGLDDLEDLASPGILTWDLSRGPAVWILGTSEAVDAGLIGGTDLAGAVAELAAAEQQRRRSLGDDWSRAADQYLVRRGAGRTIIAGYPWFTDWGRDTFIAWRGLCLAAGRLDDARDILLEWSGAVSEGMVPNRFPDAGDAPEYNTVDASLWFVVCAHELLTDPRAAAVLSPFDRHTLEEAISRVLEGHVRGTRYGIAMDSDGLLRAGQPGVQLTWMDARVDGREVTPRIGKPVEIQALWINALTAGARVSGRWAPTLARARARFEARFWNPRSGGLFDVVDPDHQRGAADDSLRPNQILAVGGLPVAAITGARARAIVDLVEAHLLTPLGLRSLAPSDQRYWPRYDGPPSRRDAAYHQGTVWPWLLGPFVEAWVGVRGRSPAVRAEARQRFLAPLIAHLNAAGIGHVSEIADGATPHAPRGCPFQAWSLGELIRVEKTLAMEAA